MPAGNQLRKAWLVSALKLALINFVSYNFANLYIARSKIGDFE